jgi:adenylylsulfate kinase-like enzyme
MRRSDFKPDHIEKGRIYNVEKKKDFIIYICGNPSTGKTYVADVLRYILTDCNNIYTIIFDRSATRQFENHDEFLHNIKLSRMKMFLLTYVSRFGKTIPIFTAYQLCDDLKEQYQKKGINIVSIGCDASFRTLLKRGDDIYQNAIEGNYRHTIPGITGTREATVLPDIIIDTDLPITTNLDNILENIKALNYIDYSVSASREPEKA